MAAKKKPAKQAEGKNPDNGHFLPGNRWWLARSSHGPKPKFATAEELWSACLEYFAYVQDNPLKEEKVFSATEGIRKTEVAKMRAMTLDGLCLFLDVWYSAWDDWRDNRPDLAEVITRVEATIRDQKFSGAACDLLNANIIARDLGLADRSELTGKGGGPIPISATVDFGSRALDLLGKIKKC